MAFNTSDSSRKRHFMLAVQHIDNDVPNNIVLNKFLNSEESTGGIRSQPSKEIYVPIQKALVNNPKWSIEKFAPSNHEFLKPLPLTQRGLGKESEVDNEILDKSPSITNTFDLKKDQGASSSTAKSILSKESVSSDHQNQEAVPNESAIENIKADINEALKHPVKVSSQDLEEKIKESKKRPYQGYVPPPPYLKKKSLMRFE